MPQCYVQRPKAIGLLVLEKKIFEGFLLYTGVAAILAMWPRFSEEIFVPPTTWNLASFGQAVLEKKIFENGGRRTDNVWTDDGACLYYKLTDEPKGSSELTKDCYANLDWGS